MPFHDWTRVPAGLLHHFHQSWSIRIADALNAGPLPQGVAALVEQRSGPRESDVLAIEARSGRSQVELDVRGVATMEPPVSQIVRRSDKQIYAGRANRIVVRHHLGRILAVIEILSPGNKDSRAALRDFVEKTVQFLQEGVHVLAIDLFPPTPRDPNGIHQVIWDEVGDDSFVFPPGKDRLVASYESSKELVAYLEPVSVGETLPEIPLFLTPGHHVPVPLEATYQATWQAAPQELRLAVESGTLPDVNSD